MLHIDIICIGKLSAAYYAAGVAEYAKRLSAFCRFEIIELAEETIKEKNYSEQLITAALQKEGERITAALAKKTKTVVLCIGGKALSSEGFAKLIDEWPKNGVSHISFIIGSSHGLSQNIINNADYKLSLSEMTLPHQMARLFLCEQIYRAFMINSGAKYHK